MYSKKHPSLFKKKKNLLRLAQVLGLVLFIVTLYFLTHDRSSLIFLIGELIIVYTLSFKLEEDSDERLIEEIIEAIESQTLNSNFDGDNIVPNPEEKIEKDDVYLWLLERGMINNRQYSHLTRKFNSDRK